MYYIAISMAMVSRGQPTILDTVTGLATHVTDMEDRATNMVDTRTIGITKAKQCLNLHCMTQNKHLFLYNYTALLV